MPRRAVNLSDHINQTVVRGHPADFPVELRPIYYDTGETLEEVPKRFVVVREDTGKALAVVSNRYSLVPHQQLLGTVQEAIRGYDFGPVPRGVFVDRGGARMRALFKFPALAQALAGTDEICPCIKIENSYDATSRVLVQIGAFRFVCTNLAVGGGGVFAGGFMAVHSGKIPVESISEQLVAFLTRFEAIVQMFGYWMEQAYDLDRLDDLLGTLPKRSAQQIRLDIVEAGAEQVYAAYNAATYHATHRMRSATAAFRLLEQINRGFQQYFPVREQVPLLPAVA